jgi:hypothetical protein
MSCIESATIEKARPMRPFVKERRDHSHLEIGNGIICQDKARPPKPFSGQITISGGHSTVIPLQAGDGKLLAVSSHPVKKAVKRKKHSPMPADA